MKKSAKAEVYSSKFLLKKSRLKIASKIRIKHKMKKSKMD